MNNITSTLQHIEEHLSNTIYSDECLSNMRLWYPFILLPLQYNFSKSMHIRLTEWQDEPFSITLPFRWVIKHNSRRKRSTLSLAGFSYLTCTAAEPHVLLRWWRCWIIDWSIFVMSTRIFLLAGIKQICLQPFPFRNLLSIIRPFSTITISPAREVWGITKFCSYS